MVTFKSKKLKGLLFASLFCLSFSGTTYALDRGSKAPDFQLQGPKGAVTLASSAGSVVYVDFWASWCGPCRQSFSWMNAMQDKYGAKGLQIIGLNVDAKNQDALKFLDQNPARFTVAYDLKGVTATKYGVKGMPTSFLLGRDGKVILVHAGFRDTDRDQLEKEIKTALEAKK